MLQVRLGRRAGRTDRAADAGAGHAPSAEARAPDRQGSYVAANGMMSEQAQILTTHNLAPLVDALNLREQIAAATPNHGAFPWP